MDMNWFIIMMIMPNCSKKLKLFRIIALFMKFFQVIQNDIE